MVNSMFVAAQQPVDRAEVVGQEQTELRALWQQLSQGEELARGKKVQFSPSPNYRLTTNENDPYDLTDGRLSERIDDRVWHSKDAVGWRDAGSTEILSVIDLGSLQPVGQIAIRLLGGKEQHILTLPSTIEFLASEDGHKYHSLQQMTKLMPAESELSNFETTFYVPEEGKAFMYPFVCRKPVMARYIAIRITPETFVFTDQISVLKAAAPGEAQSLSAYPEARVFTNGIAVLPQKETFVVTTNIITPNWLHVLDLSGQDPAKSKSGYHVEVPDGLRVLPEPMLNPKEIPSDKKGVRVYELSGTGKAHLWVERVEGIALPANPTITFTGRINGQDSHVTTFPVQLVEIPNVPAIDGLQVSLGWIGEGYQRIWPNYLRDLKKMGFGFVSTFPRYLRKRTWNEQWDEKAVQETLQFLEAARREGYRVIYEESAFHEMEHIIRDAAKAGKIDPAEAREMLLSDGKPGEWRDSFNPLYRGKYFQDEVERVAGLTRLVQPDHVYLDIEWWNRQVKASQKDPRVKARWQASGKTWEDFITDVGTDNLRSLVNAIRKAAGEKELTVGLYGLSPSKSLYHDFYQWDKLYPEVVDIAQSSLYVQGRAVDVARTVRADYEAMRNRKIIPWLTAGTYGEFDPRQMEMMVLEAVLNGAGGITYYQFANFDPMDFYYHSKALATLARFPDLIKSGKPVSYKGNNDTLHYTCFASEAEALVLVGNYGRSAQTKAELPLALENARKVSLVDGEELPVNNGRVSIEVPPGEFRLIHIGSRG